MFPFVESALARCRSRASDTNSLFLLFADSCERKTSMCEQVANVCRCFLFKRHFRGRQRTRAWNTVWRRKAHLLRLRIQRDRIFFINNGSTKVIRNTKNTRSFFIWKRKHALAKGRRKKKNPSQITGENSFSHEDK